MRNIFPERHIILLVNTLRMKIPNVFKTTLQYLMSVATKPAKNSFRPGMLSNIFIFSMKSHNAACEDFGSWHSKRIGTYYSIFKSILWIVVHFFQVVTSFKKNIISLTSCFSLKRCDLAHRIHVWYIYLHLVDFYGFHVGKYTSPMDPMGWVSEMATSPACHRTPKPCQSSRRGTFRTPPPMENFPGRKK